MAHTEKRMLRYDFDAVETHTLAVDLANKTLQFQTVTGEKKTADSQYKSRLDAIQADLNNLSNKVASGYEIREIECIVKYHKPEQGKKTVIRTDNNTRTVEKMTSEENNLFNQEDEEQEDAPGNDYLQIPESV